MKIMQTCTSDRLYICARTLSLTVQWKIRATVMVTI